MNNTPKTLKNPRGAGRHSKNRKKVTVSISTNRLEAIKALAMEKRISRNDLLEQIIDCGITWLAEDYTESDFLVNLRAYFGGEYE
jgi:hypothetical protein